MMSTTSFSEVLIPDQATDEFDKEIKYEIRKENRHFEERRALYFEKRFSGRRGEAFTSFDPDFRGNPEHGTL
jgi:hypothetical protein